MSDSTGLLIGLGVVALGMAAIYVVVVNKGLLAWPGGGGTAPVQVGDCTTGPNGFDCMKVSCKGVTQVICSNNANYKCADIRRDAQGLCYQYMPPGGGGGVPPGGVTRHVNANCDYYSSSGNYCWHEVGLAPYACAKGSCTAARNAYLKAYGPGSGYGGTPTGSGPCVTDCACVQGRNPNIGTLCPAGANSCTACWRRQGTTTPCTPTMGEKTAYGYRCPPSTGQPSLLFVHQTDYNRVLNSPSDQMRLVLS